MTTTQLLFLGLLFVVVTSSVIGLVLLLRPNATRQRLRRLVADVPTYGGRGSRWFGLVARLTRPFDRLAPSDEDDATSDIRLRFLHAGVRNPSAPAAFYGLKTVLTVGLPLAGFIATKLGGFTLAGNHLLLVLLLLATIGYYGPSLALNVMVSRRQREIFENFPDALDLMTVCIEAGLGTEAAMMRVTKEMQFQSPALADELRLVNLELRAGADRERALRNLALRTGVDEVDSFVKMINQAERFGTSIGASLRVQSDLLRTRRRQRAEEAAAKIALKLLFPLIFCIFPALMIVLVGPAMIQIYRVLLPSFGGGN